MQSLKKANVAIAATTATTSCIEVFENGQVNIDCSGLSTSDHTSSKQLGKRCESGASDPTAR